MILKSSHYQFTQRKKSIAKIQLKVGNGTSFINNKSINFYFLNNKLLLLKLKQVIQLINFEQASTISIQTTGGGLESQGKAILLGLFRILSCLNSRYTNHFQSFGFLTGDLRRKERKKYGLRKARKAPQYSKR